MDIREPHSPGPEARDTRLSRRRLLHLGTLLGLGALVALTACGEEEDDEDDEDDD